MAEIRRVQRSNPLSNFRQVAPQGGTAFAALADVANQAYEFLKPAAVAQMKESGDEAGREIARRQMGQNRVPMAPRPAAPDGGLSGTGDLQSLIDRTEGAGDYGTLFGHSQREGGAFAGTDITSMTLDELGQEFASTTSAYGQWVKGEVGRVATPLGRYQIVGTTLRNAVAELGLPGDTRFTPEVQDQLFRHLAGKRLAGPRTMSGKRAALRAEWEGFKSVSDADLDNAIRSFENGDALMPPGTTGTGDAAPAGDPAAPLLAMSTKDSPTTVRTASGALEPRLYSPMSGEILQAHNAAASTAYLSEMMLSGRTDMMNLSEQFPLDPERFQTAAREYVDEVVQGAPGMMRSDLRATLDQEMNRRFLGMMEERHSDIRKRANNSSSALMERWSTDYSEALASNNPEEAAAARQNLEQILYARESLPGVAWTREQSENAILDAERNAERLMESRRKARSDEVADQLRTIIKARDAGRVGADESILDDPEVRALHPDLATEALVKVEFHSRLPQFQQYTPDRQDEDIRELESQPIQEDWELDIAKAARDAAGVNRKAWEDDPIKRAGEVLEVPPPPLPDFNPADPTAYIAGLSARRDYGRDLAEQGYTDEPAFLSTEEAETLSALMGRDMPGEARLAISSALVSGFGEDAVRVFDQIDTDEVTRHGGKLMASGGSATIASEALRGQAMIDEGLVVIPEKAARIGAISDDIAMALQGVPADDVQIQAEVMEFAKGIYASRSRGIDPSSPEATALMADAVQAALGQATSPRGKVTGGVQTITGNPVLLPVGVAGESVEKALRGLNGLLPATGFMTSLSGERLFGEAPNTDQWLSISPEGMQGSLPHAGGEVLTRNFILNNEVRLVPMGGSNYRMEITRSGATVDVARADGGLFVIDLDRLLEATTP